MALALPLIAHLFEPVQSVVHWLAGGAPVQLAASRAPGLPSARAAQASLEGARDRGAVPCGPRPAPAQRAWGGPIRAAAARRPLRVVRVLEGRGDRAAAGRMVISGRMADVCAELDRLAALETRH